MLICKKCKYWTKHSWDDSWGFCEKLHDEINFEVEPCNHCYVDKIETPDSFNCTFAREYNGQDKQQS